MNYILIKHAMERSRYVKNIKGEETSQTSWGIYRRYTSYFRKKVKEHIGLMNRWFLTPHWGYDYESLCFIEVSDSREYCSDFDKTDEIKPDSIIRVVD